MAAVAFVLLLLGLAARARGADNPFVSDGDLQAAVRSLGFLENLPHDGRVVIGVIYDAGLPSGRTQAEGTAARLGAMPGPYSATLRTVVIATDALNPFQGRLDALFLMPGASRRSDELLPVVLARHLVSVSDDPACLDHDCCVLMVQAGPRVEIVLDTRLASATHSHFSAVFAMMVKRK